jgi:hypothetical protein
MERSEYFKVLSSLNCYRYSFDNNIIEDFTFNNKRTFDIEYCNNSGSCINLSLNYKGSISFRVTTIILSYEDSFNAELDNFNYPEINDKLDSWFSDFASEPSIDTLAMGLTKVFNFVEAVHDNAREIVNSIDIPGKRATFFRKLNLNL